MTAPGTTKTIFSFETLDRERPLYLYGAGGLGSRARDLLHTAGFANIQGFIDSFKTGEMAGLPVFSLEDYLVRRRPEDLILVTTTAAPEVATHLAQHGITDVVMDHHRLLFPPLPHYDPADVETAELVLRTEDLFPARPGVSHRRCHVVVPVWGEVYIRRMCDLLLPSLLAAGNLPALLRWPGSTLDFYMFEEDAANFRRHPLLPRLAAYVGIRVHVMRAPAGSKYATLSRAHHHAILAAEAEGVGVSFLPPDAILADGGLQATVDCIERGYQAVLIAALDGYIETTVPKVERFRDGSGVIAVAPRDLVGIMLDGLDRSAEAYRLDSEYFSYCPSQLHWHVPGQGILVRPLFRHPLMVFPQVRQGGFTQTVDYDYAAQAVPQRDAIYFLSDSDEIFLGGVICQDSPTGTPFSRPAEPHRFDCETFRAWLNSIARPFHRESLKHPILFHRSDLAPEAWHRIVEESARLIDELLDHPIST